MARAETLIWNFCAHVLPPVDWILRIAPVLELAGDFDGVGRRVCEGRVLRVVGDDSSAGCEGTVGDEILCMSCVCLKLLLRSAMPVGEAAVESLAAAVADLDAPLGGTPTVASLDAESLSSLPGPFWCWATKSLSADVEERRAEACFVFGGRWDDRVSLRGPSHPD